MNTPLSSKDWEALSAYLDGQLSEREQARLQQRMAADPELQRALEGLRQTKIILRSAPRRRAPRNFTINPKMVPQRRRGWFQPAPAFSFGAVFATIMLIFTLAFQYLPGLVTLRQMASPASQTAAQAPAATNAASLAAPQVTNKSFGSQAPTAMPPLVIWGPIGGGASGGGSGGAADTPGAIGMGGMGGGPGGAFVTSTPGTGAPVPIYPITPEQSGSATSVPPSPQAALNGQTPTAAAPITGTGPILGIQPTQPGRDLAATQVEGTLQADSASQAERGGARQRSTSPGGINLSGLEIGLALLALGLGAAAFLFRRRS